MNIPRFNVLGVAMSAMDLPVAVEAVIEAARARRKGYICVTGVHGVTEAQNDPAFRGILNGAFLNTTDGMPLVWLGRHFVGPDVDRVSGPTSCWRCLRRHKRFHFGISFTAARRVSRRS